MSPAPLAAVVLFLAPLLAAAAPDGPKATTRSFATADELVALRIEDSIPGAKTALRRLDAVEIEAYVARGKDSLGKDFILTPVEGIASISIDLPGGDGEGLTVELLSYATTARSQENYEYMRRRPHWIEPDRAVVGGYVRRWGYRVTSAGRVELTRSVAKVVEDALGMYFHLEDPNPSPTPPPADDLSGPVDEGGGGFLWIPTGDGFAVEVPAGWTLDNRTLAGEGIHMLFYPMGGAWKGEATPVFAYVMPRVRRGEPSPTKTLIDLRTEQLREVDPDATTKLERDPTDAKGERITIVRYTTKKVPRFERVAYVEGERVTWAVILSASSAGALEKWSPFVDAILRSHRLLVRGER